MSSYTGIIIGSIFFGILGVLGCIYGNHLAVKHSNARISAAENRRLSFVVVTMAIFCMWLHWICAYMHQMNPIIQPTPEAE